MSDKTTIHKSHRKEDPFTKILNSTLRDARLTFKARGLLAFMLGHPNNWETRVGWIEEQTQDGREAIRSAFAELEKYGYLVRERVRAQNGLHDGYIWHWHEEPSTGDGTPLAVDGRETAPRLPSSTKKEEDEETVPLPAGVVNTPHKANAITPNRLKTLWNTLVPTLGTVREVSPSHLKSAKARGGEDVLTELFIMVEASDFLTGRTPSRDRPDWKASLDWVLKPDNYANIANGKYTNKPKTTPSYGRSDSANLPGRYT